MGFGYWMVLEKETGVFLGEVGFVAPFRYTSLVLALAIGWLVFDEWPAVLSLIGAAIIMGTGLFTLWREQRRPRLPVKPH